MNRQILIVEDSPVTRALLVDLIHMIDPEIYVEQCETLEDTRNFLDQVLPDAIILDLNLPDSLGIDTFLEVKKLTSAPIIVATGDSEEGLGMRCLQAGTDKFIYKNARILIMQIILRDLFEKFDIHHDLREIKNSLSKVEIRLNHIIETFR